MVYSYFWGFVLVPICVEQPHFWYSVQETKLDRTWANSRAWFKSVQYHFFINNRLDHKGEKIHKNWIALGQAFVISAMLEFTLWQNVPYHSHNEFYPYTKRRVGHFLGVLKIMEIHSLSVFPLRLTGSYQGVCPYHSMENPISIWNKER